MKNTGCRAATGWFASTGEELCLGWEHATSKVAHAEVLDMQSPGLFYLAEPNCEWNGEGIQLVHIPGHKGPAEITVIHHKCPPRQCVLTFVGAQLLAWAGNAQKCCGEHKSAVVRKWILILMDF